MHAHVPLCWTSVPFRSPWGMSSFLCHRLSLVIYFIHSVNSEYVPISVPLPLGIHTPVPYVCDYACFANRIIYLTRPFLPSWSLLHSFLQASLSISPLFLRLSSLLSSRLAGIPRRISWWDMNEGRKSLVLECISILCHKTPWNQFFNVMFCLYNCTCPPNKFSKVTKK